MMRAAYFPEEGASATGRPAWMGWCEKVVLYGFIGYTFIGTQPFLGASAAARADGNIVDRFVVLGLFALSLVVLWNRGGKTLKALRQNSGILALVAFAGLSIVWSQYPDLTLRRAMLLVFLSSIALSVAVSIDDIRRFHTTLFVALGAIMLFNLAGVATLPSITHSEIGAKGFYTQKNVLGAVALITMIVGAAWALSVERRADALRAWAVLALVFVLLVLTKSKTSLNLAVLGVAGLVFFALFERYGLSFGIVVTAASMIVLLGVFAWLGAYDFDVEEAWHELAGDTSFTGREDLWKFTVLQAEKRYWLGHGYGAFWDVGLGRDPLLRAEAGTWLAEVELGVINQAHHGIIELWLHIGLPAAIFAALLVLKRAVQGAFTTLLGAGTAQEKAAFGALSMLLFLHLIHNQTEATLFMRGQIFASMAILAMFILSRQRVLTGASTRAADA